jgi:signal transduction histidine kinase
MEEAWENEASSDEGTRNKEDVKQVCPSAWPGAEIEKLVNRMVLEERLQVMATMGQLVESVIHDTNNLLLCITAAAYNLQMSSLERSVDKTEWHDNIEGILGSVSQITDMLQRLSSCTYSQEMGGRDHVIKVDKVIAKAVKLLSPWCQIGIESFCEPDLPLVAGDPCQLLRIFVNIIVNAQEAGAERVFVKASSVGGVKQLVRITLSDNGFGIPPEIRDQVFEPSFSSKGNKGLGLSICYNTVKELGGQIKLESVVGEGATFTIALPAAVEADSF